MRTYDPLARKPGAFKALTGRTVEEFEAVLAELRPRDEAAPPGARGRTAAARSWGRGPAALCPAGAGADDAGVAAPVFDR